MSSFPPLHPMIVAHMAERSHRLGHLIWHTARERWLRLTSTDRDAFIAAFGSDWVPPRPSLDEQRRVRLGQGAGLDFLYMHRLMVKQVREHLQQMGEPDLTTWDTLPLSTDPNWPAPEDVNLPPSVYDGKDPAKWDALATESESMVTIDALRGTTVQQLDEIGSRIEYGVHAAMHQRFAVYSVVGRRRGNISMTDPIDTKWDDPRYDCLIDPYAAHVNPAFWYIHLWIDRIVDHWESVNGPVPWGDRWLGPMQHSLDNSGGHHVMRIKRQSVATFLLASGNHLSFRPRATFVPAQV